MNVRNCPRCNRIFVPQSGRNICPVCIREEEDKYEIIREYLRDNPGATLIEVVNATGVDEDIIMRFIREGRIESKSMLGDSLKCERCGAAIESGKLCRNCQMEMAKEFQRAASSLKPQPQASDSRTTASRPKDKVFTADMRDKLK